MKANQTNNSENWPVCPECIGLNGSKKRNWMENHADYIVSYYEMTDLEQACHYFNCKPDTMMRFLKRHDLGDKKLIRQDEITRNRVGLIDTKVYDIMKELDRQDIGITELISRGYQLTDIIIAWYEKQARDSQIMVAALKSLQPGFTYHQDSRTIREVSPTPLITEENSIKSVKAGPISVGRHFISNKRTGESALPGHGKTHGTLRERYQNAKARRYRRV